MMPASNVLNGRPWPSPFAALAQALAQVEGPLLLTMIGLCYVAPGRLPFAPISPHGLLLVPLIGFALVLHRDRLFSWAVAPYWSLLGAMVVSAAVIGEAGRDVARPLTFGVVTAMVIYTVGRPTDIPRLFRLTGALLALDAALSSALLLFPLAPWPVWLTTLYGEQLGRPLHRGFYLLAGAVGFAGLFMRSGRWAWLGLFSVTFVGVVLTTMRGLWVGMAIALLTLAIFSWIPRRANVWGRRGLILVLASALLLVGIDQMLTAQYEANKALAAEIGRGTVAAESARERAASHAFDFTVKRGAGKLQEELSAAGRLGYWIAGWRMFQSSPLVGIGPGNFPARFSEFALGQPRRDAESTSDAHNMFVSLLAELGLLGLAAVLFLCGTTLRSFVRCRRAGGAKPGSDVVVLTALAVGVAVVGLTWDIHIQRITWVVVGLWHLAIDRGDSPASAAIA